jgi:hypothetical protein
MDGKVVQAPVVFRESQMTGTGIVDSPLILRHGSNELLALTAA